jgi:Galactose oxidase, central domain
MSVSNEVGERSTTEGTPPASHGAPPRRIPPSARVAVVTIVLVLLFTSLVVVAGPAPTPSTGSVGTPTTTRTASVIVPATTPAAVHLAKPPSPSTTGADQLRAAQQSLANGGGPALGAPLACAPSSENPGTDQCASPTPPPARPLTPAAPGTLGLNLGWDVVGVPTARGYINFAMTWDAADGYVLLFGGSNATGVYLGDTWTYESGVWTQLAPLITPTARDSSGLAYSGWDNSVLLFGGYTPGTGGYLNDTWLFKGGTWTQVLGNGPSPRFGFGLVWDPTISTVRGTGADVLFGGASPQCGSSTLCNDTWYWVNHGWVRATPAHAPPARYELSMMFDALDNHVVLFGGYAGAACFSSGLCNDTWELNATAGWVQVGTPTPCGNTATGPCTGGSAPSGRDEASFAWDTADGYAVLFAGHNQSGQLGDTWKYSAGTWTRFPITEVPALRFGAALTFDPSAGDNYLLLFGGDPNIYVEPQRTFVFTAGSWLLINPPAGAQPEIEYGGMMTYDAADGYVLLFGGYSNASHTFVSETWKYAGGVWSLLLTGGPPALEYGSMVYDPAVGYVVLFAGFSGGPTAVTYGYAGGSWFITCQTTCNGFTPPSARYLAAIAFDAKDGYVILFGGFGGMNGHSYLGDTWAYIPYGAHVGYWVNETAFLSPAPAPRDYSAMVSDDHDGEIVLFGGWNGSADFNDLWVLPSLSAGWSQPTACGGPGQSGCPYPTPGFSFAPVFVYDSLDQVVVWTEFGNTYVYQGGQWTECSNSYTCFGFYGAQAPENDYPMGAYDAADGYTIVEGGYGGACSYTCHNYYQQYSWVFGRHLWSQGPGFTPQYIDQGETVTFSANVIGGGVGNYSLQWSGLPWGCAPPSSRALTFTCQVQDLGFSQYGNFFVYGSYYDPSVVVEDSSGFPSISSPQSYSWLNSLYVAPDLKIQVNSSASVADVGQVVTFEQIAVNGWGPYAFFWNDLPPGCVAVTTGSYYQIVKCTLGANSVGTWLPYATEVDTTGFNALSSPVTLVVEPSPTASGVSVNTVALDAGQTLSIAVTPSGGSGSYTYTWSSVPSACLANAAVLTCVVPSAEVGSYDPAVTLRDSDGGTFSESYSGTVVVSAAPTATALTVTNSSSDPTAAIDVGQSVTFSLTSTAGSGGDTVVWTGLPAGCTPSGPASTSVACTPSSPGSYAVGSVVKDSNGVSATSPQAILVISPTLGGGAVETSTSAVDVGQPLTIAVTFKGGSGGDTFAWTGLPTGCVASDSASLTCSPSAAGSSTPSVTVRDSNGGTLHVAAATALVVSPAPQAAAAPFATSFQWLELALLALLIVLVLVAVVFALRRPPAGGSGRPPAPTTPEPRPDQAATPPAEGGSPDYHET